MRCAIIGNGREGQWWQKFLSRIGSYTFEISDRNEDTPRCVNPSQLIILAVPMSRCGYVAEMIAGLVKEDQMVISACGLMSPVTSHFTGRVQNYACIHRMIGPQVETMKGHRVLTNSNVSKNGWNWNEFYPDLLEALGGNRVEMSAIRHDIIAWETQGKVRKNLFALAKTLVDNPELMSYSNVPFDGMMLVLDRILAFGPELSWDMMRANPVAPVRTKDSNANLSWVEQITRTEFDEFFEKLREMRGKDTIQAGSNALVKTLNELRHIS